MLTKGEDKKAIPPENCHPWPIMMKLGTVIPYQEKIQKTYKSRGTPLEFCLHKYFFSPETANFALSRNTDIYCILIIISNAFNFFLVFRLF